MVMAGRLKWETTRHSFRRSALGQVTLVAEAQQTFPVPSPFDICDNHAGAERSQCGLDEMDEACTIRAVGKAPAASQLGGRLRPLGIPRNITRNFSNTFTLAFGGGGSVIADGSVHKHLMDRISRYSVLDIPLACGNKSKFRITS
jgi:hypothetical protein